MRTIREKYESNVFSQKSRMIKALRTINNNLLDTNEFTFKIGKYNLPIVKTSFYTVDTLNQKIPDIETKMNELYEAWHIKHGKHYFKKKIQLLNYEVRLCSHIEGNTLDTLFEQFKNERERTKTNLTLEQKREKRKEYKLNAEKKKALITVERPKEDNTYHRPIRVKAKTLTLCSFNTCYFSKFEHGLNLFGIKNLKANRQKFSMMNTVYYSQKSNNKSIASWIIDRNVNIRNGIIEANTKTKINY
jgi:hypothetical protein